MKSNRWLISRIELIYDRWFNTIVKLTIYAGQFFATKQSFYTKRAKFKSNKSYILVFFPSVHMLAQIPMAGNNYHNIQQNSVIISPGYTTCWTTWQCLCRFVFFLFFFWATTRLKPFKIRQPTICRRFVKEFQIPKAKLAHFLLFTYSRCLLPLFSDTFRQ